jgi:hypothetical protein
VRAARRRGGMGGVLKSKKWWAIVGLGVGGLGPPPTPPFGHLCFLGVDNLAQAHLCKILLTCIVASGPQMWTIQTTALKNGNKLFVLELKVLESVSFFLGGKKCRKIVNIGVMRNDRAAQQRLFRGTILRGLTQPLNAYGYKYISLLLLLFYPFVAPADLSQQAKSASADGLFRLN